MVETMLYIVAAYAGIGVLWLLPFHRSLLPRLDESANGASRGFHVLVSPGLIALWPVMLWKWSALKRGHEVHGSPDAPVSSMSIRRSQSFIIKVLAVALPLLVAAAVAMRPAPPPPVDLPAVADTGK